MLFINLASSFLLLMSFASSTTAIPPVSGGSSAPPMRRRDIGRYGRNDQSVYPSFVRRRDRRQNQVFAAWDRTATPTASTTYNAGDSTTTDAPVVRVTALNIRSRM